MKIRLVYSELKHTDRHDSAIYSPIMDQTDAEFHIWTSHDLHTLYMV